MPDTALAILENTINSALDGADIGPTNVDRIVRTGGSSSIPAFVKLLERQLPGVPLHQAPPFTTVARGLGRYAQHIWS